MTSTIDDEERAFRSSFASFDHIKASKAVISVFSAIHFALFAVYTCLVLYQYLFYYGYLNMTGVGGVSPPPGSLVDRRYSFLWILILISTSRILLYFLYQFLSYNVGYSWWAFSLHRLLCTFFIVFDVIYLLSLAIQGWTCNSYLFIENQCNDFYKYCVVFGDTWPSFCSTGLTFVPGLDPTKELSPSNTFLVDFYMTLTFLALDILQILNANSLNTTISRFIFYNKNVQ